MLNAGTALARVLVDELARGGVTEAVIAPGSRSAPLALAFAEHPAIRAHVRIDERSAAFVALGLAKTSGRPVPVVCTSGTAAANFHPAVLEAAHTGTRLVVLTCDRPLEARGTGSNQTIDQAKLYGGAVAFYTEFGTPEVRTGMAAYWRSVVCRGLAAGGPIHLNVPFRFPLLPDPFDDEWPDSLEGRANGEPWTAVARPVCGVPELTELPERGIVVVADGAEEPERAIAFAESLGWPLLAEPGGNGRRGPNAITTYAHLLAVPELAERLRPDLIVTVGKPTLARSLLALYPRVRHVAVSTAREWPDPARTALRVVGRLPDPAPRPVSDWLRTWQRFESTARVALDKALEATPELTELRVARDLPALIGPGAMLFVGSSSPIRNVDLTMAAGTTPAVLTNRGVSGIDGCVSTAVGMALAHQAAGGGAAFALLGDLTLVHDQNGLIIGPQEPRPDLTVVVVNNDGGGFFSQTPFASLDSAFERFFATPHGMDLAKTAAAAGWEYRRVSRADELPGALFGDSTRLVEVRTDRVAAAAQLSRARVVVTEALLKASH